MFMNSQYAQGYTDEANYCPYCGERVGSWRGDGSCTCSECGAKFFVIEAEDSSRKAEEEDD